MTALLIILGILLFLFLLSVIPIRVVLSYGEEMNLTLKYLFFQFQLLPEQEEPPKPKKAAAKSQKKAEPKPQEPSMLDKLRALIKKKGVKSFLALIKEITVLLSGTLKNLMKHVKLKTLDIYFVAASDNAGDAAILYGEACAVVYPAVNILCSLGRCRDYHVSVDLDYSTEAPAAVAYAVLSVFPLFAAKEFLHLLVKGFPYLRELA